MLVAGDERGAVPWSGATAPLAAPRSPRGAASVVAAIARQNTMLAAAARASDINGDESDGVAIIDLAKRSVTTRCVAPAGAGAVVRVAWDAQLPQLLYAGTASGRLLVYNSRARTKVDAPKDDNTPTSRGSAKTVQTCKLVHSIEGHAALPLSLALVKGTSSRRPPSSSPRTTSAGSTAARRATQRVRPLARRRLGAARGDGRATSRSRRAPR